MCGFCVVIFKELPTEETITHITEASHEALHHRGPDGQKSLQDGAVLFVHNRLAIIDVVHGDHPLFGPSGETLIANGEIYNYVEEFAKLDAQGVKTPNHADFTPFLYQPETMPARIGALRGMFALCVQDSDMIALARDRFGIKPLYMVENAQVIAFASQPSAFFAAGFLPKTLRDDVLPACLYRQFYAGALSCWQGVERIAQGEIVTVQSRQKTRTRMTPLLPCPDFHGDYEAAKKAVKDALWAGNTGWGVTSSFGK
ncbi:MAG: hypothetical protein AAF352_04150 [Pseudomonadota bacterium]